MTHPIVTDVNVYIPTNRRGWWGGQDTRPRCRCCDKVVFPDQEAAERSAAKVVAREGVRADGKVMQAYLCRKGKVWHVGHGYAKG